MIDFLGIGAQKCGTTWLYEHLKGHPQIRFPAGKEIHFWDSKREQGIAWWLSLFPKTTNERQGEITPAYALLDLETIAAVKAAAPALRLFYSIRNPIARAWSSALMALGRAELTIDEVSDQWFVDHFQSRGSRQRGNYPQCIKNWLTVFPDESFHLTVLDDQRQNPKLTLVKLAAHIGVDTAPFLSADEDMLRLPIFQGPVVEIRPRLLAYLRRLYADEIEQLGRLLARDFTAWSEWDGRHR